MVFYLNADHIQLNSKLLTIDIPPSVNNIVQHAFYRSWKLTTVNFTGTSQLQTIGDFVFLNCPNNNIANFFIYCWV